MTITLPEELERLLEQEVAAGRAKSVEAAVVAALRARYMSREDLLRSLDEAEAEYNERVEFPGKKFARISTPA